ncbi:MAG: hypothetical protein JO352_20940 [Chloroflexi bacterium]|nr:hypothetical protein [Chloroflexota bacterium]MBV9601383.1 hypothetical protein [Chloroflexota bacterium]
MSDRQGWLAVLAAVTAVALWTPAAAQQATPMPVDELGNTGDFGTGAVYRPQTPEDLAQSGAPVQINGVDPVALPPGTDTTTQVAPGEQLLRGPILHAEGDLVLIWLADEPAVVQLPAGVDNVGPFGPNSLLQAIGTPTGSGTFQARQVLLWATPAD